jgi:secreted PhoX family phosphatase
MKKHLPFKEVILIFALICNANHIIAQENNNCISCFTSLAATGQAETLDIPSTHRFQLIFKQGESYTVQNDVIANNTVPGNHDFTGYVPISGSSTLGYVSVNHETNPGGVSILDVSFNTDENLWNVNATEAVDFYDENLVTTIRNCSGGVTPMGTIITAEESSSDDSNNDGYLDVGWLVEIDPVTKQVMDYDNDGIKDKLWAMGKMNHENVVVSNDGTVAYYGEDGGTQCLYKFVPDTPFDLSSGDVFVLVADINDFPILGNGEVSDPNASWVQVPNDTQEERNNIRDTAASLGGTNFNGVEDAEISVVDDHVYFASKGYSRIYRFTDDGTSTADLETFVGGVARIYILNTESGSSLARWASGNDNITIDNDGNVWVLQDGDNNYVWVVGVNHTQLNPDVRIFSRTPTGAEPTGLTFTPDNKYGFYSIQHPSGTNGTQTDATGNDISFNGSATVVFALEENLGAEVLEITEYQSLEGVSIYPNPTTGIVNIELTTIPEKASVNVFDMSGRQVLQISSENLNMNQNTITVDISQVNAANGMLLLQVTADNKRFEYKILKTTK